MQTVAELAALLRTLRRRQARQRGDSPLTYRELAATTGWSHGVIGGYFAGTTLPPTDRFDVLIRLLGANPAEQGALATARDRVEDRRHDTPAARAVPAQLPGDVSAFTGRAAELALLDQLTAGAAATGDPPAVLISAVSGTAGVGKTALAVRWGHQVRSRFPDGTLYVDLRGYGPGLPVAPEAALTGFLAALGITTGQELAADVEALAARYRTELAGRRMLVVLDNAATVEQVRPLLPGAPSCLVVVTSRDSLAGLVARHGAHRLNLDLLPPADAQALLHRLIGPRVAAESDAAAALAEQCARLPLALRVAAELATGRPSTPLAELVGELRDEQHRLDLLDAGGDPHTAVRAVFSWSYRQLPADAGRAFRRTGLDPGPDLDIDAAAALFDSSTAEARRLLTVLDRAHLVHRGRGGRHRSHDLLRAYAAYLAGTVDPQQDRRQAVTRLLDHYLGTAAAAMDTLFPSERDDRPPVRRGGPSVAEPAAAQAWLDAHRPHLVAAVAHAAGGGWPQYASDLASTLARYLDTGGHRADELAIHPHAVTAARNTGDRVAEARALMNLGAVHWQLGKFAPAAEHLRHALDLARQVGHRRVEIRALGNLSVVAWEQGNLEQAVDHLHQTLAIARQTGDRVVEARALGNVGVMHGEQGRLEQAVVALTSALDLFQRLGDEGCEARTHDALGTVYSRQGDHRRAVAAHEWALTLFRQLSDRSGEASSLLHLGRAREREGDAHRAAEHHRQALALFREMGESPGEAKAYNSLGTALRAAGDPVGARAAHTAALAVALGIGSGHEQARAHDGIAATHLAAGNTQEAEGEWRRALALYTELAMPEADTVRSHLAELAARTEPRVGRVRRSTCNRAGDRHAGHPHALS